MKREEFEAIKKRAHDGATQPMKARAVIICERNGHPIHPDELGPEGAASFKLYCEAIGVAVRDRLALLEMIENDFEIGEYLDGTEDCDDDEDDA